MALNREHITQASRVMLPTYAVIFLLIGFLLVTQSRARTSAAAFQVAKMVMPIHLWGWVFLAVAVLEGAAIAVHRRGLYLIGLTVGVGLVAFWAVILGAAAVITPTVSFTGAVWVGGWVAAYISTALLFASKERG